MQEVSRATALLVSPEEAIGVHLTSISAVLAKLEAGALEVSPQGKGELQENLMALASKLKAICQV